MVWRGRAFLHVELQGKVWPRTVQSPMSAVAVFIQNAPARVVNRVVNRLEGEASRHVAITHPTWPEGAAQFQAG